MAPFKQISSKNADYGAAEAYLTFEHDEFTMKPTLDENGRLAAVRIEDEATLKRVYIENDRMVLQPINTSYAPIILIKEEINSAVIEGKAVGLCRDL